MAAQDTKVRAKVAAEAPEEPAPTAIYGPGQAPNYRISFEVAQTPSNEEHKSKEMPMQNIVAVRTDTNDQWIAAIDQAFYASVAGHRIFGDSRVIAILTKMCNEHDYTIKVYEGRNYIKVIFSIEVNIYGEHVEDSITITMYVDGSIVDCQSRKIDGVRERATVLEREVKELRAAGARLLIDNQITRHVASCERIFGHIPARVYDITQGAISSYFRPDERMFVVPIGRSIGTPTIMDNGRPVPIIPPYIHTIIYAASLTQICAHSLAHMHVKRLIITDYGVRAPFAASPAIPALGAAPAAPAIAVATPGTDAVADAPAGVATAITAIRADIGKNAAAINAVIARIPQFDTATRAECTKLIAHMSAINGRVNTLEQGIANGSRIVKMHAKWHDNSKPYEEIVALPQGCTELVFMLGTEADRPHVIPAIKSAIPAITRHLAKPDARLTIIIDARIGFTELTGVLTDAQVVDLKDRDLTAFSAQNIAPLIDEARKDDRLAQWVEQLASAAQH